MTLIHKKLRAENDALKVEIARLSDRRKLPDERTGATYRCTIGATKFYLTTGEYADGSLGEIFLCIAKEGESMRAYDLVATAVSIGLQYGIPLEVFVDKFKGVRMAPSGVTQDPDIPLATSIFDYVARRLELDYMEERI